MEKNKIIHQEKICDEILSPLEIIINENELDEIIINIENKKIRTFQKM